MCHGTSSRQLSAYLLASNGRKDESGAFLASARKNNGMGLHLLVAVGHMLRTPIEINFINSFFKSKADLRITLLSALTRSGSNPSVRKNKLPVDSTPFHRKRLETLDAARTLLLAYGLPEDRIGAMVLENECVTMDDVVREAVSGLYAAVLLRKGGRSLYDEFFSFGITRETLNQESNVPMWICNHAEAGRKNVLLCVDETDASMRMAEHVASILHGEPEHGVTVFHVDTGERSNVPEIVERARQKLIDGGISNHRVAILVKPSQRVIGAIREEAAAGAYAVAAFGHERRRPKRFKAWLAGSRCLAILETLDRCALWVGQ